MFSGIERSINAIDAEARALRELHMADSQKELQVLQARKELRLMVDAIESLRWLFEDWDSICDCGIMSADVNKPEFQPHEAGCEWNKARATLAALDALESTAARPTEQGSAGGK